MGLHRDCHHSPGREIRHRRQGSQREAIAKLDGSLQNLSRRPLVRLRHAGRSPSGIQIAILGLPNDMPGPDAHYRVSVVRCTPCTNPHNTTDLPRYLPTRLTQYIRNNYARQHILGYWAGAPLASTPFGRVFRAFSFDRFRPLLETG